MTQNINLNIVGTANFLPAISEIKKLKTAMSDLQNMQIGKGLNTQLNAQLRSYEQDFLKVIQTTKSFNVEEVKLADATDHLTTKLSRGQFSLGEYYSMFKRSRTGVVEELNQIAQAQAKVAKSMVIPSQKGGYAQVITDMSGVADKIKTTEIYQKALNTAMMDGTTKLINFGKNTQWAGRQLTVGLTVPLMAAGGAMAAMFYQVDQNLRKMQAVYGVGGKAGGAFSSILPSQQEIASIRSQVVQLSQEMARTYGQTAQETAGVAADLAAAGYTGNQLLGLTKTVTKAMVLGESDRQTAMKATIALQSAYKLSTEETATALNFFSAAQAATSTTMRDLIDAIPRVGPVVRNLGGSYKDTVAMLVAMKEGGVAAGEGANALKNSLGRLISPTKTAVDSLKVFGVDILGIVNKNSGNVVGMIEALQQALSKLSPLARQQAITDIFGKFQMSRMTALLDNFNQSGTQSAKVMQMMGLNAKQLSDIAANQTKNLQESTSGQFKIAIETLKADLMPIGETFLQVATVLVKAVDFIVKAFDKLGPVKYVLGALFGGAAVLGPIIMFSGLMANLVGQVFKLVALFKMFRGGFAEGGGWSSPIKSLTTAFAGLSNYFQEVDKAMVASEALSKDLNATMMKQEDSLNILTAALTRYTNAVERAATINNISGGGIVPPPNGPSGGPIGPGGMPFAPTGGPTSPAGIIGNATRPTMPVRNTMSVNKSGAGEDVGRTGFVYENPSGNKVKGNEFIHLVPDQETQNVLGKLAVVPGYFDVPNSPGVALNRNLKDNPMPIIPPAQMTEDIVKNVLRDLKLPTSPWSVEAHAPAMSLENITTSESSKIAMLRAMQQMGPSVLPQLNELHKNNASGQDVHNFFSQAMGPEQWQSMRQQAIKDVLAAYESAQTSVHEQLISSGKGSQIGTTSGLQAVTAKFGSELLTEYKLIINNMDQQVVSALSIESEKTGQGLSTAIREGMRRNAIPALVNLGATASTQSDLVIKEFENLIHVAQQAMAKIASQVGSTAVEISAMSGVGTVPVINQAAARVSRVEQIAKGGLGAVKLATGGKVQGPGGPKDDVIPAMLSDGEYVVNANAVGHYGTGFLDAVNTKKLASGGPAGSRLAGIMDSLFGREKMQSSSQIQNYLTSPNSAYAGHNIQDFFASRNNAKNVDLKHIEDLISNHQALGTLEEQQLMKALEEHASGDWGNKGPLATLDPRIVDAGRASLNTRLSQMPGDTVRLYRAIRTTPETGKTAPGHYGYIPAGQAIETHQPYTSYSSDIEKAMTFVGNGQITNARIIEVDVPKSAIVGIQNANYTGKPGEGEFIVRTSDIPGGSRYVTFTGLSTKRKNSDDPLLKFLGKPGPESKGMLLTDIARRYTQMPSSEASSKVPGFWDESQRQYAETRAGNFNFGPRYSPEHQLEFFGITPEEVQIARQHLEEKYGMQFKELAKQKNKKIIGNNYEDQTLLRLVSDKEFIPAEAPGTMSTVWSPNYINRAKGGGVGQFHHRRFYQYHPRRFKYSMGNLVSGWKMSELPKFIKELLPKYAKRNSPFSTGLGQLYSTSGKHIELQSKVSQELKDIGWLADDVAKGSSVHGAHSVVRTIDLANGKSYKIQSPNETVDSLYGLNSLSSAVSRWKGDPSSTSELAKPLWDAVSKSKNKEAIRIYNDVLVPDRAMSLREMKVILPFLEDIQKIRGPRVSLTLDSSIAEIKARASKDLNLAPKTVQQHVDEGNIGQGRRGFFIKQAYANRQSEFERMLPYSSEKISASGGTYVSGPGGPKDDKIPAMLSNGEYVVNADSVKHYGVGFMDYVNAKKLSGGGLLGMADGGEMKSFKVSIAQNAYDANKTLKAQHEVNQEELKVMEERRKMAAQELQTARRINDEIRNDSSSTEKEKKASQTQLKEARNRANKTESDYENQKQKTIKSQVAARKASSDLQIATQRAGITDMSLLDPSLPKEKGPLSQRIKERYRPAPGEERRGFKAGMGSMVGGTALQMVGSMAGGALEANAGGATAASQAMSMAGTGAMMGSMLGPEGMLAGAAIGGVIGGIMGHMEEDQRKLTNSINETHQKNLGLISSMSTSSDTLAQLGITVKSISDIKLGDNAKQAEAYSSAINQVADAMANGSEATKSMINYIKTATSEDQRKALGQQFSGVLAAGGTIEQATVTAGGAAKAAGLSGLMSSIAINEMKSEAQKAVASGKSLQLFGAEKQFAGAQAALNKNGGLNLGELSNKTFSYKTSNGISGRYGMGTKNVNANLADTLGYSGQTLPEGFMLSSLRDIRGKSAEDIGAKGLGGAAALGSNDANIASVAKLAKVTENMSSTEVESKINAYLLNLKKIPDEAFKDAQNLQDAYDQINTTFTKPMEEAIVNMKSSDFKQYINDFTSKFGAASDVMKTVADKIASDLSPEMQALEGSLGNSTTALGNFLTAVNAISGLHFDSAQAQAAAAAAITANPSLAGAAVKQTAFETQAASIGNAELNNINGSNKASSLQTAAQKSADNFAKNQKAAQRAYQKEQQSIQDSIKSKGKYIDSIRKEMDARQKLYDKKQQGIEQEQTLQGLENNVYKARTHGSLLDQAAAMSAYNSELNKQADLKAKQAADEKDQAKIDKANETVQALQDSLDTLSRKYDAAQQKAQDVQDATQASYKTQIATANKLGDTTAAKQAAWQQGWTEITHIVETGGKEIPKTLLDDIANSTGVAKTQILADFANLQKDFDKQIGPNGLIFKSDGTMTALNIPNGVIQADPVTGELYWKPGTGAKTVQIGDVTVSGKTPNGGRGGGVDRAGKADGGYISGPGNGTSDSIPARLSNGEYVIRANAVSHYGQGMMDAINTKKFASGGPVGDIPNIGYEIPYKIGGPVGGEKPPTTPSGGSPSENSGGGVTPSSSKSNSTYIERSLINLLLSAKFKEQGLRMAWSIAMRESGGEAWRRSPAKAPNTYHNGTYDAGLFQLNSSNYKGWHIDMKKLFDGAYQAKFVEGFTNNMNKNLLPWGLNPDGTTNAKYYSGWSKDKINNNITKPFRKFYDKFPAVYFDTFSKKWDVNATSPSSSVSTSSGSSSSSSGSRSSGNNSPTPSTASATPRTTPSPFKPVKLDLRMSVPFEDAADLKNIKKYNNTFKVSGTPWANSTASSAPTTSTTSTTSTSSSTSSTSSTNHSTSSNKPWYKRMAEEAKSYAGKVDYSGPKGSPVSNQRSSTSPLSSAVPGDKTTYKYKNWKSMTRDRFGHILYHDGVGGWGCSEFTFRMLEKYGKMNRYTNSFGQMGMGSKVKKGDERPGDLIFYHYGNSFNREDTEPDHVGIFIGNNKIVSAAGSSQGTAISKALNGNYLASRRFADGGSVFGPGGPKDDKIPAMLSNGEYVIKADSVTSKTKPLLDMINSGTFNPKFTTPASRLSTPAGLSESANNSTTNNVEYNLTVTVDKTNASPEDIASVVIQTLKRKEKTNRTHRNL